MHGDFKIMMYIPDIDRLIDMPNQNNLGLIEACWRADLYKKKNGKCTFHVVHMVTGDFEYTV